MRPSTVMSLLTLALVAPVSAAMSVSWISGQSPPDSWSIDPPYPGEYTWIEFSGPTDVFPNECVGRLELGGTPGLAINWTMKIIWLFFEGPPPEICPPLWDPVCGLEGSFGPLTVGTWKLWDDRTDSLLIEFEVHPDCSECTVETLPAADVRTTTATLHGKITEDCGQACQYSFRYYKEGDDVAYTSWRGSKTAGESFTEEISGLSPGSLYYVSARARNGFGSCSGAELSFRTLSECFPPCHDDYTAWLSVGKPECWCVERQCHGDADGIAGGGAKTGLYYVGPDDLNVLIGGWLVREPPEGPGIASVPNGICADFAHDIGGSTKTGQYRVGPSDLNILIANWLKKEPPQGPGIGPDCLDCP